MKQITNEKMESFRAYLINEEKSEATVSKYLHDVNFFVSVMRDRAISKQTVLDYKSQLGETYAVASANSMIAALNCFLRFCGWHELCVKQFKMQRQVYCPEEKELTRAEYIRLLEAANAKHNERLNLIIQTICGTGIRVSELQYITVEALRNGEAIVNCKGKTIKSSMICEIF